MAVTIPDTRVVGELIGTAPLDAIVPPFPHGTGDNSGNLKIDRTDRWIFQRIVAPYTDTLTNLWIKWKVTGGASYEAGDMGNIRFTVHPVNTDGTPNVSTVLYDETVLDPLARQRTDATAIGVSLTPEPETINLPLNLAVTAGQELAVLYRNVHADPANNYSSPNFLYTTRPTGSPTQGLWGAQGRNCRTHTLDRFYGLDARELTGGSLDGGATWNIPGDSFTAVARNLPTYACKWAAHNPTGQPYFGAAALSAGVADAVLYRNCNASTCWALGCYIGDELTDTLAVTVRVNGQIRAQTTLTGSGFVFRRIPRVTVPAAATVVVSFTPTTGNVKAVYGGSAMETVMGFGPTYKWSLASAQKRIAPVHLLPTPV